MIMNSRSAYANSARAAHEVELKDLDALMTVAEIGSLRGAAALLGLEPSAISRRVRRLEDRLGASLLERSRSGVRLTNAGRLFHNDARNALNRLDDAIHAVGAAGQAANGEVSIGIVGSLSSLFVGQLIRQYRAKHPSVALNLSEGSHHDHLAALTDRSLDLAFVPGRPTIEGCGVEHLWSEPIVAVLASDDVRSAQSRLSLASLAEDQFIVSRDPPGRDVHDLIVRSLSQLGFHPRISRYKVSREALILMVGLGFGTSLTCGSEMRLSYPQVTFVPLDGEEVPFSAIWSPQNDNPALRRFLSLARCLSREKQRAAVSRTPDPSS